LLALRAIESAVAVLTSPPNRGVYQSNREVRNIMAQIEKTATLRRLCDTELTVADPAEDIRDRKVVDRDGEELGEVNDLLIDDRDQRVRFLEVASGGFLGIGQTKFLLPSEDTVYVNQTRQHIAGAPAYDPDLIHEDVGEGYYGDVYRHYGYPPYWGPGYTYPPYPYYP
jgi:sporulation protein YlmC with PRC-barrel domain